jgi:hypothetical protein
MRTYTTSFSIILCMAFIIGCSSPIETDDSIASDIPLSTSVTATDSDGNRYETGFNQIEDNQQNPFVRKYDANNDLLWEIEHDNSPVDVRGILVTIDLQNRPWVVFTLDGGSSSSSYLATRSTSENAFSGVFQSSYGQGGGPTVSVITRLNPENGIIERGTFLTARLNNGNTNTLRVRGIGVADGFVRVQTESAFRPPYIGTSFVTHPEAAEYGPCGVFLSQIDINQTLTEITESNLMTIQEASALQNTVWNQDCSLKQ